MNRNGSPKRPCTAKSGRKAVTFSGKPSPTSSRKRSIQVDSASRVAAKSRSISSSVSLEVHFSGESRARCRISSE